MKKRELSKYLAKIGSKGGKKAAAGMTKEQRVARARKASAAKVRPVIHPVTIDALHAMAEDWMNTKEAAAYLKVEPDSLLRGVREGRIPAYKLSGTKRVSYRFLARDLDVALRARPVQGGAQ